jgi:hypothetical protein
MIFNENNILTSVKTKEEKNILLKNSFQILKSEHIKLIGKKD